MSNAREVLARWIAGREGPVVRAQTEASAATELPEPASDTATAPLGERHHAHQVLRERLREVNHRSSNGGGLR
jgi:hypothetical protein